MEPEGLSPHSREPFTLSSSYSSLLSCHRPFLPGTSLEPAEIRSAQASSFRLQYFPYYVWRSKCSGLFFCTECIECFPGMVSKFSLKSVHYHSGGSSCYLNNHTFYVPHYLHLYTYSFYYYHHHRHHHRHFCLYCLELEVNFYVPSWRVEDKNVNEPSSGEIYKASNVKWPPPVIDPSTILTRRRTSKLTCRRAVHCRGHTFVLHCCLQSLESLAIISFHALRFCVVMRSTRDRRTSVKWKGEKGWNISITLSLNWYTAEEECGPLDGGLLRPLPLCCQNPHST